MPFRIYKYLLSVVIMTMLFVIESPAQPRSAGGGTGAPTNPKSQKNGAASDSTKMVPRELKTWCVDERFGSITPTVPDTVPHLFQNMNFTDGLHGEYSHTGNISSPRFNRIYNGQQDYMMGSQFLFARPYGMVLNSINDCVFTNTRSPITNLSWLAQGNQMNGDDRLRALFATNINKDAGIGFKVDYLFGRGYYSHQHHSSLGAKLYGSYRGERYSVHAAYIFDNTKNAENGGLTDETYITNPDYFSTQYAPADMPTRLDDAYNHLRINTLFLTHRYNLGYYVLRDSLGHETRIRTEKTKKKAPAVKKDNVPVAKDSVALVKDSVALVKDSVLLATDSIRQIKDSVQLAQKPAETDDDEVTLPLGDGIFVPIASIIHTAKFDTGQREYYDNSSKRDFYINNFFADEQKINDETKYLSVENTVALEMNEGFKKWVKTGMRLYGKHQLTSFTLPDVERYMQRETFNYITLGAQLMREQGRLFHYNVLGEIRTTGKEWGEFNVQGNINFDLPIRRDSVTLRVEGYLRNEQPTYYYRHFHGANAWWDNDLSNVFRARVDGILSWRKTRLKVGFETIQNHTYFQGLCQPAAEGKDYALESVRYGAVVRQADKNIQVLSATLCQDFKFGPLMWENELTVQQTSDADVLPLPLFNGWSNLYFHFRVAKVLLADLGADVRYFTKYDSPVYNPFIGQYTVQDANYRTKVGNYPWVNVYANFHLKTCRFYVMFSHVNCGDGNYFLIPHYPTNQRCLRIGISWNFFN